MRIAFLILAHNTPRHIQRLVAALRHPDHRIFVHIDRKQDLTPFLAAENEDVRFVARREVEWGDISAVHAALDMLRAARAEPGRFDYYMLMSGSDYPLYPAAEINRFLAAHSGTEFLNSVAMPAPEAGKPIDRFERFYPMKGRGFTLKERIRTLLHKGRKRNVARGLNGLQPYGGSAWWALTDAAVDEIFRFARDERRAAHFLANTYIPEEAYFQTVIGNSRLRHRIGRNLHYTDWSKGGPNPATLGAQHLPLFAADLRAPANDPYGPGLLLFARKFDDSTALLDRLDALVAAKRVPEQDLAGAPAAA